MKRLLAAIMLFAMMLSLAACSSTADNSAAASTDANNNTTSSDSAAKEDNSAELPDTTGMNDLYLYVDGVDVTDGNITYESIQDKFAQAEIDGNAYHATTLTNLCAYDISSVVGVFAEAVDGFVRYYNSPADVQVVVAEKEDGTAAYGTIVPGQDAIVGIGNIYMVTTPAAFSVPVKVNGEEIGQLTLSDFMKKTPVGDQKVTTAMYDGSFKYKGGEATYNGRFLGIDYETMLAKLEALGMPIEGEVVEAEFYGTPGMGKEGKNTEYALYPDESNYFKNVEFFCMYDGMTNNTAIKDVPMGLSVFVNGTGQKWVTYNLTEINFITE